MRDTYFADFDRAPDDLRDEWDYVLQAFEGRVASHGWHREPCPKCFDESGRADAKKSLSYNTETGGYNCYKCGIHGALPRSYQEKILEEDIPWLSAPAVGPLPPTPKLPPELAVGYTPVFDEPGRSLSYFDPVRDYLLRAPSARPRGRGLSEDACAEAGIGASLFGKLVGRAIVPLPDYERPGGPWRGWVGRDVTGTSTLPYLYCKNLDRDGYLYCAPALFVRTDRPVFVVEGTLDAVSLWPDAVAVLGKPLDSQLDRLCRAERPVVVCLDGDAWEEGWGLAMKLRFLGRRAGNVRLPPRTDPDEVPRAWLDEEARRALERAF